MIDKTSYSKEWIDSLKLANKGIDPALCEKMIRALGLLEELALTNLEFVFKGGTSLIFLVDKPERFSIDIDIVTVKPNPDKPEKKMRTQITLIRQIKHRWDASRGFGDLTF